MNTAYVDLPEQAQVHRMRQVARAALADYPIEPVRLRLLDHAYNTTFRVDTADGRRFALRINVNSPRTEANLTGEAAWLDALAHDTDIDVPAPQPTRTGALRTSVGFEPIGRDLPVLLMSWLPGRDMDDGSPTSFRALGRLTAGLHEHAERWTPPPDAAFPPLDDPLIDAENRLLDDHPLIGDGQRELLAAALEQVGRHMRDVASTRRFHALHADLHGGNLKWLRGQLAVFDFDDSCLGAPVHDLAISAYYLRDAPELEAALLDGYAEVRPLPEFTTEQFEAIVAARNLVLVNDVLTITTADVRAMAPRYVANTVTKLRAYLDTGVYRHDVPGLIEAGE